MVVQMASAIGLCNANILPVDADHFEIVKPAGPDDASNVAFKSAFNRVFGSPSDYLAMEGQLRGKMRGWINRIFALQSSNGGIRIESSNPKARTQVWTTAQCLQAVLSSQPNLERYVPQIKAALNYLEKTRRSNPQQGWGVFEEDKDTHTEIAGWVTLANISSLESRTNIWNDAERVQMLARIQRDLTRLVERQDESGGWSEVQVKGEEFTRVYPTVIALWSLLEAKKSESLNELLGNRLDENIRKGSTGFYGLTKKVSAGSQTPAGSLNLNGLKGSPRRSCFCCLEQRSISRISSKTTNTSAPKWLSRILWMSTAA